MASDQLQSLSDVFRDGLLACLEECAHGRPGLFRDYEHLGGQEIPAWPEAARLRELAAALQSLYAQEDERNALCEEFLDLCTMHGEYDPGEPRLARELMKRIDRDEVGSPTQKETPPPWAR